MDECERLIEADDYAEAEAKADALADEFDGTCPDDAQEIAGGECESWFHNLITPARSV